MQVATAEDVFLFDLNAICGDGALQPVHGKGVCSRNGNGYGNGSCRGKKSSRDRPPRYRRDELAREFDRTVGDLFSDDRIVKLGFSFRNDAAHLRRTWPEIAGFRNISALLEVRDLSEAVLGREVGSLSNTCEAWLGKPLDKTECASRWDHR